jgi:hypothetical protein
VHSINSRRESEINTRESIHSINSRGRSGVRDHGWIVWATASIACILAAALAVAALAMGASQVSTRPAAEIYFYNPSKIATWTGARSVAFTFVAHNLARKAYQYRYVIYTTDKENGNVPIVDKVLALGPQQQMTIRQTIRIRNSARFRISVSLAGTKNIIFFWTQAPSLHSADSKR